MDPLIESPKPKLFIRIPKLGTDEEVLKTPTVSAPRVVDVIAKILCSMNCIKN